MGKKISKNISSKYKCKYSQKLFDHPKQSATNGFKTATKREIQKMAEATVDLISNKNSNKITSLKTFTTK